MRAALARTSECLNQRKHDPNQNARSDIVQQPFRRRGLFDGRGASMYERAHGYNSALGTDDFTGRTTAGISIGAPQTSIVVHGGADPQTTADYVLKGADGRMG